MEIIPAIDIIDNKCVRLTQGDYKQKTIYNQDPLEVAKIFEYNGLKRLHLVDLEGAYKGQIIHWKILEQISSQTNLVIDFSGGIKKDKDIKIVFDSGAQIASIGSIAIENPSLFKKWIQNYGPEKIILGADIKNEKIAIHGWRKITKYSLWDFLEENIKLGVKKVFCTDINKDGLLSGSSTVIYEMIIKRFPMIELIASGGIISIKEFDLLYKIGCHGLIIGKAIYENKILLTDITNWIQKKF